MAGLRPAHAGGVMDGTYITPGGLHKWGGQCPPLTYATWGGAGLLPGRLPLRVFQTRRIRWEEAIGPCGWSWPQCPAWGESLVPGARAGSVPTVHQVSLREWPQP